MIVLFLVVIMVWAVVLDVIDFIAMQSWSKFGTYRYPIEVRDKIGPEDNHSPGGLSLLLVPSCGRSVSVFVGV